MPSTSTGRPNGRSATARRSATAMPLRQARTRGEPVACFELSSSTRRSTKLSTNTDTVRCGGHPAAGRCRPHQHRRYLVTTNTTPDPEQAKATRARKPAAAKAADTAAAKSTVKRAAAKPKAEGATAGAAADKTADKTAAKTADKRAPAKPPGSSR